MPKYIFVTGGVVSSLGKGLAASSIGCLLEARGLTVTRTRPTRQRGRLPSRKPPPLARRADRPLSSGSAAARSQCRHDLCSRHAGRDRHHGGGRPDRLGCVRLLGPPVADRGAAAGPRRLVRRCRGWALSRCAALGLRLVP